MIFLCLSAIAIDGDTLRCQSGERVRIAAINAQETTGNPCPRNRPCPDMSAQDSKTALASMVQGKALRCHKVGMNYDRIVAQCSVGGVDVGCEMTRIGAAAWWPRYARRYGVGC